MNYLFIIFLGMFSFLMVCGLAGILAYGQVQPEVDIQPGASSGENAVCVTSASCFAPNPLHVIPGTTITWKNQDYVSHTITSVNNLCNGPHMTIQIATDTKSVDPTVMIRTSLTGVTYAKLAKDQPYTQENVNADIRRLVYEAYVSPSSKSFEVIVMEGIGHNTYSIQKEVQVSGCDVGLIFDSGTIASKKTFQHTFTTAGNYNYFCTIHPWLVGQVIVDGVTSEKQSDLVETPQTNSSTIPEFPFAIPVMLTGIISVLVFYRTKL
ncbi:MAG TPA: plastocyanin/azurin family copper-binding protein [Candidatus Nitrosotalea sp.]|nr:plastocyanin/azurin family copper-binding protein [Candidatus Nitrosotalea sp.]